MVGKQVGLGEQLPYLTQITNRLVASRAASSRNSNVSVTVGLDDCNRGCSAFALQINPRLALKASTDTW